MGKKLRTALAVLLCIVLALNTTFAAEDNDVSSFLSWLLGTEITVDFDDESRALIHSIREAAASMENDLSDIISEATGRDISLEAEVEKLIGSTGEVIGEAEEQISALVSEWTGETFSLEETAKELIALLPENADEAKLAAGKIADALLRLFPEPESIKGMAEDELAALSTFLDVKLDELRAYLMERFPELRYGAKLNSETAAEVVQNLSNAIGEWLTLQGERFLEGDFFSDRPIAETLPEVLGVSAGVGEAFAAFLSRLMDTQIQTGNDLKDALPGWLEKMQIELGSVLLPIIGASCFSLFMFFSGMFAVAIGELTLHEYAVVCQGLAIGMVRVVFAASRGEFREDAPD